MKPKEEAVLDPDVEGELLAGMDPIDPSSTTINAMRGRILARVSPRRGAGQELLTIRPDQGKWVEIAPNVHLKRLVYNENLHAQFIRMAPGSCIPAHPHASDEECVVLEGEVRIGDLLARAGDFHFAPRGIPHGDLTTETGCLLYIRTAAP